MFKSRTLAYRLMSVRKSAGLGLDAPSLYSDLVVTPVVDTARMSAKAVINAVSPDRESDVIVPRGVDYSAYRRNPVVMWEHGLNEAVPTAIAKSEHPDGRLSIEVFDDRTEATSYFTDKNVLSEQIFALVDAGIVRATSIHVDPVPQYTRTDVVDGRRVTIYDRTSMLEWSWTNVGVHPEAVRKCLDIGRLAGRQIVPSLAKTLNKHAAQARRSQAMGVTLPKTLAKCGCGGKGECKCDKSEGKSMAIDRAKIGSMTDAELSAALKVASPEERMLIEKELSTRKGVAKSVKKGVPPTEDAPVDPSMAPPPEMDDVEKSMTGEEDEESEEGEDGVEAEGVDKSMASGDETTEPGPTPEPTGEPYGAQVMAAFSADIMSSLDRLSASLTMLENPQVKTHLEQLADRFMDEVAKLAGVFDQAYPDHATGLVMDSMDVGQDVVKSWAARGGERLLRGLGWSRVLDQIATDGKLTKSRKKQLAIISKELREAASSGNSEQRSEALERLKKSVSAFSTKLDALVPVRRK